MAKANEENGQEDQRGEETDLQQCEAAGQKQGFWPLTMFYMLASSALAPKCYFQHQRTDL